MNLIDGSILSISSEIRKIALIIILTRAGLSLDISGIKKIGRPAVMMCFVPASFELIVLFTTFISMIQGKGVSVIRFVNIPVSIVLGILIGLINGWMLAKYFEKAHIRDTIKILIILSLSFILVAIEDALHTPITFSALIAIMFIGVALQKYRGEASVRLSAKYNKLWVGAEVFLFVLVGATINIGYLGNVGAKALIVIAGVLVLRMLGAFAIDLSYKKLLER